MTSRRTVLVTIASATASAALASGAEHEAHTTGDDRPAAKQPSKPVYFQQSDYEVVSRLADLIIPRTDTPGAVDADVPHRIDLAVAHDPELQQQFREGLNFLAAQAQKQGKAGFLALGEDQQIAILKPLSENKTTSEGQFFRSLKNLTLSAYYRSYQGLVQELEFKGNTYRANFPGCTHPEHWPA